MSMSKRFINCGLIFIVLIAGFGIFISTKTVNAQGAKKLGQFCNTDVACETEICNRTTNVCTATDNRGSGTSCLKDAACESGICLNEKCAPRSGGGGGLPVTGGGTKTFGQSCKDSSECVSPYVCNENNVCGYSSSGGGGGAKKDVNEPCRQGSECKSGVCKNLLCTLPAGGAPGGGTPSGPAGGRQGGAPAGGGGNEETRTAGEIALCPEKIFSYVEIAACYFLDFVDILIVVFIVYVGFQFMTAGGDATKVGKAKDNLKYVIIGVAIVIGVYVIIATVAYNIGRPGFAPFYCPKTLTIESCR